MKRGIFAWVMMFGLVLLSTGNGVVLGQTEIQEQVVVMKNIRFAPETITIKRGMAVVWTNEDSVNHQISSDSGPISFDSEAIRPGEEYFFTFDAPGTYEYHCNIHPFMRGKVIVTE